MKVTVRSALTIARALGSRELVVEVPEGTTVERLVADLVRRHGDATRSVLWDEGAGRPLPFVRLLVNGRDIAFLGGLATELKEDDELLMIPPAGGG